MTARRPRAELLPNANNPRLLLRLLHLVSRGIRSPRALAEILEIELRTVHYYTQAAAWLGLLAGDEHAELTDRGLALTFAEESEHHRLYAEAVWSNAFVQQLLAEHTRLPEPEALTAFIMKWEPQLSESTARRRSSAVRALIEPALALLPRPPVRPDPAQVDLPFTPVTPPSPPQTPQASTLAGREENPDIYAVVLCALLDAGELSTAQIRALLDAAGGQDCSMGGCIEMAMRRGDGHRIDDRIVASSGAIRRRELAGDGALVALSDPLYRRHVALVAADKPDPTGERQRLARRFAFWDLRLLGRPLEAATLTADLEALLVRRRLDSVPVAGPIPTPFSPPAAPFVETLDRKGLLIAFPASVVQLAAGVAGLGPLLRAIQQRPAGVRLPSILDERIACHGGLLHPGERPPRVLTDNRSLRLRALTHCPAYAMLAALLLLDRRRTAPLALRRHGESAVVSWRGQPLGGPLAVFSAFSAARGWLVCRPPSTSPAALSDKALLHAAQAAGILQIVGERLTIRESLFSLLQEDLEARLSYEPLLNLEDRLGAWLELLPA